MSELVPQILEYDVWPQSTRITLVNVPWDSRYRDTVRFTSANAQKQWFDSRISDGTALALNGYSYHKINEPLFLGINYSAANKYNYLVVENPAQEVPNSVPTRFYYFIVDSVYESPETTQLTLQLDVWQSFILSTTVGYSFCERGHIAICNNSVTSNPDLGYAAIRNGALQRYLTAPEGLDVGNDYTIAKVWHYDLSRTTDGRQPVIIITTMDLVASWGTIQDANLKTADGQLADGLLSGCNVYVFDNADIFRQFMSNVSQFSWIAQGIISIYSFPGAFLTKGEPVTLNDGTPAYFMGPTPDEGTLTRFNDFYGPIMARLPSQLNSNLFKFLTYPYAVIEMTTWQGSPVMLKPELFWGNEIVIKALSCALMPFARVGVYPDTYGRNSVSAADDVSYTYTDMDSRKTGVMPGNSFIDCAAWINEMPQFSIVNNNYITYLASTQNTRSANYASAGWGLARSSAGADLAYNQAGASLNTAQENKDIQNVADVAQGVVGAVGSLANLQVGSALTSAASTGINLVSSNMQFGNSQSLGEYNRSTNQDFAQYANQGDYENAIRQIDAAVQDAALMPPSVVGQTGGAQAGFNMSNGLLGVTIRVKVITENAARIIGNYWSRYGYYVKEFVRPPANLHCMTNFTYWKLHDCKITASSANETQKDTIRGIFQEGVTVWQTPELIGNLEPTNNNPLTGISY